MPRPTALLKRSLIFVHRWLGIALTVVFLLWFPSGIVMMYWGMPGVSSSDRLERAPVLDVSQIKLSPSEAWATLARDQQPASVTLTSFDGRPVYRFGGGAAGGRGGQRGGGGRGAQGNGQTTVYADDGTQQTQVNDAMLDRIVSAWARLPLSEAKKESVTEPDQWTIEGRLRSLRPMYKYSFNDGQQVYISGRDAQVVQYTTTKSRFWAYLGVIPHWLYWTPFRVHQPQWFNFVVYSSLIGTGTAIIGMIVGVWMYSPAKKYRHAGAPTSIPYKGQKRWHTIFGLVFGLGAATWAFSGYLSMGPFDWVQTLTNLTVGPPDQAKGKGKGGGGGPQGVNIAGALRGRRAELDAYAAKDPRQAIEELGDFKPKEIEFTTYAGEPIYMATNAMGDTKIVPIGGGVQSRFDPEDLMSLIRENGGGQLADLRIMDEYDAYYLDRRGERPLPVIYAEVNDAAHTRYYIDIKTARVAGTYSSRNWVNRWLYHGLHSLDFPWLYKYRPLWDIVVIAFMLGGTALCVTSLVLSWRVLKRKLAGILPADNLPTEEPSTSTASQSASA